MTETEFLEAISYTKEKKSKRAGQQGDVRGGHGKCICTLSHLYVPYQSKKPTGPPHRAKEGNRWGSCPACNLCRQRIVSDHFTPAAVAASGQKQVCYTASDHSPLPLPASQTIGFFGTRPLRYSSALRARRRFPTKLFWREYCLRESHAAMHAKQPMRALGI
jgi:hypothetical protein